MKPGHLAVEKLCQRIVATIPDAVVFADGAPSRDSIAHRRI